MNALANFTFLTQETNLLVSDKDPGKYIAEYAEKHPGTIESHWIPMDPELWKIENYRHFLAARRELLTQAANNFLNGLLAGSVPESRITIPVLERTEAIVPGSVASEDEEQIIIDCAEWVSAQGLPEGEIMYEISDPDTGDPLAVLDLAWPAGLQEGLSQPVALLLDEGEETEEVANHAGFRYFTSFDEFQSYVRHEILAEHDDVAAD